MSHSADGTGPVAGSLPAGETTAAPPLLPTAAVDLLLNFSDRTARLTHPDELLSGIVRTAADLLDLPYSLLLLRDPATDELKVVAAHGASIGDGPTAVPPRSASAPLRALAGGRTFVLEDYQGGPPLSEEWWEPARKLGLRALIATPLLAGGEYLGSLHAGGRAPRVFTPVDIALLERLARLAAQALSHTRALSAAEQRAGALESMQAFARSMVATQDLDPLLEQLLERAAALTGATGGTVMLWDEAEQALVMRKGYNAPAFDNQQLARGEGLVGQVFEQGVTLVQNSYQQYDGAAAVGRADRLTNVLVAPLLRQGKPFGTLAVFSKIFKAFTAEDSRLLTLFASQAAVAIDNQALYSTVARQQRQLDSIIRALHDALVVYARDGRVLMMNPAAEELVGIKAQVINVPLEEIAAHYDRYFRYRVEPLHDWAGTFEAVLEHGVTLAAMQRVHSAPVRTVESFFFPYYDETGAITGVISTSRDVSATQELERVRAELAVARQQDDFLSIAAHELRTPITAIKGYSDLLGRRLTPAEPVTERDTRMLGSLSRQVGRLSDLVNDLLDVGRLQAGRLDFAWETVEIAQVVEAALEAVRPVAGAREADLRLEGQGGPVRCDPARLEQVFVNLLTNALKYSTDGPIVCHLSHSAGRVCAVVEDHGIGIAFDDMPQLFQRFFRAHDVYAHQRGLGLGLYITHGIVERHDGRIWAQSTVGQGSRFFVELPEAVPGQEAPV
jgi:signal transduction histidine kinase